MQVAKRLLMQASLSDVVLTSSHNIRNTRVTQRIQREPGAASRQRMHHHTSHKEPHSTTHRQDNACSVLRAGSTLYQMTSGQVCESGTHVHVITRGNRQH